MGTDVWDFAITLASLRVTGIPDTAIRSLLHDRYVEHAVERTRSNDPKRVFQKTKNLSLRDGSCFVLTRKGIALARQLGHDPVSSSLPTSGVARSKELKKSTGGHPLWDQALHTLFWHGRALKHFKHDAPNQEAILRVFQAQNWPQCVAVSLPPEPGVNPKDRLHNTITNLNRSVRPYLRFTQEGSGSRVC